MKAGEAAKYSLDFPRRVQEQKKEELAKLPSQVVQARAFAELLDALTQDPNTARSADWLNLSGTTLGNDKRNTHPSPPLSYRNHRPLVKYTTAHS